MCVLTKGATVHSLFLYVYYSGDELAAEYAHRRASLGGPERTFRRARRAWLVVLAVLAFALAVLAASAVVTDRKMWADVLGVSVAALACVQWVPQAVTTWRLGHLGSLSLASVCISAPVGFVPLRSVPPSAPRVPKSPLTYLLTHSLSICCKSMKGEA